MPCKPPEDHTIVYQMENIIEAAISFGIDEELQKKMVDASLQGLSPYENKWSRPIETIPCANVKAEKKWKCDNRGSRTCSGCRLVRYCSEVWPYILHSYNLTNIFFIIYRHAKKHIGLRINEVKAPLFGFFVYK